MSVLCDYCKKLHKSALQPTETDGDGGGRKIHFREVMFSDNLEHVCVCVCVELLAHDSSRPLWPTVSHAHTFAFSNIIIPRRLDTFW